VPFSLSDLEHPIILAPLGGGPATTALTAAVCEAGGLGFLAAGYKTPEALRADLEALRGATSRPFGLNIFAPPGPPGDAEEIARYAAALEGAGEPRHHDDAYTEKVALAAAERVPVVSFTFGCPAPDVVAQLQATGASVWATVTTPAEAVAARDAGVDALVAQGVEAGGHRGSFDDAAPGDVGLLALLQLVIAAVDVPIVAAGGIATGRGVAAVLAAGASAAALGSAFMLADEAGTAPAHREAFAAGDRPTAVTRAFTGRSARGIVNRFLREHDADAPSGYPEVHHVTAPIRATARERGDAETINLWAGQAYALAPTGPAGDIVRRLSAEARAALTEAARRFPAM
jgi:nitronate monooxygenase